LKGLFGVGECQFEGFFLFFILKVEPVGPKNENNALSVYEEEGPRA
jgi:hypothetical protein